MKTSFKFALAAASLMACLSTSAQTTISEKNYQLPKCAAPVASVVVGKLVCKSASCQPVSADATGGLAALVQLANGGAPKTSFPGVGDGLSAMLTTVLKETGCFDIQERESLDELAKELALVGKKVEVQQADFMISGSITSINMSSDKASIGGGFIPVIGMLSITTKKADVALDIKLIDVNRAKIVDSKTFVANNETSSTSIGGLGFGGAGVLMGGLSSFKDTQMEPLIRDILAQVAVFASTKLVSLKTPAANSVSVIPVVAATAQ